MTVYEITKKWVKTIQRILSVLMKVKMVISGFVNLPISSSSEKTLSTLTLPCPRFISHIEQFPFYNRIYFMVAWRSILFYLFTRSYVRYCTCSIWKTTNEIFFQLTYAHQCSVIKINWLRSNDLVTFLLSNKYFWSVSNFLTCACVKLSRVCFILCTIIIIAFSIDFS